jgi:hypothetical protein
MRQGDRVAPRRLFLKGVGFVAALTLIWFAAAGPVHATCSFGRNLNIVYYSDATHTKVVGTCSRGPCPGAGCTGTTSRFATAGAGRICEICS